MKTTSKGPIAAVEENAILNHVFRNPPKDVSGLATRLEGAGRLLLEMAERLRGDLSDVRVAEAEQRLAVSQAIMELALTGRVTWTVRADGILVFRAVTETPSAVA